jgi:hypothetical protein
MKKEQLQIIKDALENLTEANGSFEEPVSSAILAIDREIENIGKLREEFQEEFDEMSEKQQESDKGEKLNETIVALEEIVDELSGLKDEFDDNPFDEIINKLEGIK